MTKTGWDVSPPSPPYSTPLSPPSPYCNFAPPISIVDEEVGEGLSRFCAPRIRLSTGGEPALRECALPPLRK